jgi:hypothetical protein
MNLNSVFILILKLNPWLTFKDDSRKVIHCPAHLDPRVDVFWSGTDQGEEAGWYRAAVVNSPVAGASHLIYLDPPYSQEVLHASQSHLLTIIVLSITMPTTFSFLNFSWRLFHCVSDVAAVCMASPDRWAIWNQRLSRTIELPCRPGSWGYRQWTNCTGFEQVVSS